MSADQHSAQPVTSDALKVRRILAFPGREPVRNGVRISWANGRIAAVEDALPVSGDPDLLALPALTNAHEHGRGVRYSCHGGIHAPLERWLPTIYFNPPVDPWLNAVVAIGRHARAGISASVHCHLVTNADAFEDEAAAVARAARDVGIRLALVLPQRDRNLLAYGPDEALLSLLAGEDREAVRTTWARQPLSPREQVARVERVGAQLEGGLVSVLHGPIAPQWCSNALLEAVSESSARTGRRVHMHLLETRIQREWADNAYPDGLISYLDRIGFLSPRLTIAHGVWLRPDEMDRLAERGVILSINTSSNLRLHSGRAPAADLAARGVALGLGIDSLGLDDDNDGLRELRLAHHMHAGTSFDVGLPLRALLEAVFATGARAVTGHGGFGALKVGAPADILVVDYGALTADVVEGLSDPLTLVLTRACSRHVRELYVNGRHIVANGDVITVPLEDLERELAAKINEAGGGILAKRFLIERYQSALETFYAQSRHTRA